ncbi:MAG TPA: OmpA family protein, partial [Saprospiraceae bacterium]|nr:OmpA family protein [Saprospiraceae bacterium]
DPALAMDGFALYFSSNREPAGFPLNYSADYESPYDMYSSSLNNGEWSEISALNPVLNTRDHELLSGFNENGRIVYFRRGEKLNRLNLLADTLRAEGMSPATSAIDFPHLGAEDELYYFTDSILILSSNRPGGLGGFDLYYSIRSGSQWSSPVNLGIRINSPFDEVSPSLAEDGRTLFFSSNNLNSMGGFDVFTAHFDDHTETWSEPVNFGMPVNSGDDDRYFRMLKNKLGAVFASNRKTGTGGFDIYFAYFRQSPAPQGERSRPLFFAEVPAYKSSQQNPGGSLDPKNPNLPGSGQKAQLKVPVIYYLNDEQLKLPAIQKKMDEVVQLLKQNPAAQVIIEVFSDRSAATISDDLMYSVLRGETVRDYLVQGGVRPSRISVKGYGQFFPVAKEKIDGLANPAGKSLNRRIEFTFYHPAPEEAGSIFNQKDLAEVDARMQAPERSRFLELEKGLNYKIMLLSSGNAANFRTDHLDQVFIDKNNLTGKYELMSGVFTTFALANQARKKWMASGYEDALVVPYYSNQRIPPQLLNKWSEKFPDLTQFIYRGE